MPSRIIVLAILIGLYSASYGGEIHISQRDTVADSTQVERVIAQYGKRRVIAFLLKKNAGQITVDIHGKLHTVYGTPDHAYVTPCTVLIDLEKAHVSPYDLAKDVALQDSRQKQETEKPRGARAQRQTPSSTSPGTAQHTHVPGHGDSARHATVWVYRCPQSPRS